MLGTGVFSRECFFLGESIGEVSWCTMAGARLKQDQFRFELRAALQSEEDRGREDVGATILKDATDEVRRGPWQGEG